MRGLLARPLLPTRQGAVCICRSVKGPLFCELFFAWSAPCVGRQSTRRRACHSGRRLGFLRAGPKSRAAFLDYIACLPTEVHASATAPKVCMASRDAIGVDASAR